jgi:hypothetical protein
MIAVRLEMQETVAVELLERDERSRVAVEVVEYFIL